MLGLLNSLNFDNGIIKHWRPSSHLVDNSMMTFAKVFSEDCATMTCRDSPYMCVLEPLCSWTRSIASGLLQRQSGLDSQKWLCSLEAANPFCGNAGFWAAFCVAVTRLTMHRFLLDVLFALSIEPTNPNAHTLLGVLLRKRTCQEIPAKVTYRTL